MCLLYDIIVNYRTITINQETFNINTMIQLKEDKIESCVYKNNIKEVLIRAEVCLSVMINQSKTLQGNSMSQTTI